MIKKENIKSGILNKIIYFAFFIFLSIPVNAIVYSFQGYSVCYRIELVYSPYSKNTKNCYRFHKILHQDKPGVNKNRGVYKYSLFHFNNLVSNTIALREKVYQSIEKSKLSLLYSYYNNKDEVDLMF
jgi:hypothetical protein